MKSLESVMQDIIHLSSNIETNYPELYMHIMETPMHINNQNKNDTISLLDLVNYLETLKAMLLHHIALHKLKEK